jgi:hypothetical protein
MGGVGFAGCARLFGGFGVGVGGVLASTLLVFHWLVCEGLGWGGSTGRVLDFVGNFLERGAAGGFN